MRLLSYLSIAVLTATPALADPILFTDHEGREVALPAPAERIASIPIPMASTLIAIDGATDRLVGMNPTAKSAILEGILGRIFPEAQDIPSDITAPNFIPNVEELARVNPDLVIQWAGRGPDYVDPITNAGLNLMTIMYGTEERTRDYMTMAATAMGRPERIEALIDWRAQVQAELEARTAGLAQEDRPTVLYLLRAMENLRASGTENNYNAWYHGLAGGRNAAEEMVGGWADVSVEQVAAWNPDVIFLNSFEADLTIDRILNDPILSMTDAARNGRIYKMPLGGYRWDPPNQESPLTWIWTAELLHPDLFDYDLRAEMRAAYRVLYDHDLTDAEIDEILWMDMQGGQANYAQFAAQ
ncbi:ABC transporter substrate-binding protein [Roseicyclus marinus]|uniref:ABC transporter substrate-binding protein n=1 Tax=Roseicyclus marinus TaxID=2161673 RepID=UPI00240EB91A|nr:ABC transporter substrate-binding protein [Roseicyclus marinus]MDG3043006.1 ABC transporter substrate-binding protein [Roseicyclus marinus]